MKIITLLLALVVSLQCYSQAGEYLKLDTKNQYYPPERIENPKTKDTFRVSWILMVQEPTECPDFKPDDYGRWPQFHCAVYHSKTVQRPGSKDFVDITEAKLFYDQTKKQEYKCDSAYNISTGKMQAFVMYSSRGDITNVQFSTLHIFPPPIKRKTNKLKSH